jgi:hypothetical protein
VPPAAAPHPTCRPHSTLPVTRTIDDEGNNNKNRGSSFSVMLVFPAATVWSMPGIKVDAYVTFTDNLFQNYSRRSDWITLTYFEMNHSIGQTMGVYYSGNANVFAEYEDLFTHRHEVGFRYYRPQGGRNGLFTGVKVRTRLDKPVYRYYDSIEGEGYVHMKKYLRPSLLSWFSAQTQWRHYYHAPDYSYIESGTNARLSQFLPTRTTLELRARLGAKSFVRSTLEDALDGEGRLRSGGSRNLTQITLAGKVAQTLSTGLGLQVEYSWRTNLSGRNRYEEINSYNIDEELFDDRYSYDQKGFSTVLKKMTKRDSWIKLAGGRETRTYLGRPALDLNSVPVEDGQTRKDNRWRASLGPGHTIPIGGIL